MTRTGCPNEFEQDPPAPETSRRTRAFSVPSGRVSRMPRELEENHDGALLSACNGAGFEFNCIWIRTAVWRRLLGSPRTHSLHGAGDRGGMSRPEFPASLSNEIRYPESVRIRETGYECRRTSAVIFLHHVGAFLADHDARGVRVCGHNFRHDRRVGYTKVAQPADA